MSEAFEERYEGEFLEGLDIAEGEILQVTVSAVFDPGTQKDAGGKKIKEAVLAFSAHRKKLVMCKTNVRVLWAIIGKDETSWLGWKIPLKRRYYPYCFKKQNEMCIRVIPPVGTVLPGKVVRHLGRASKWSDEDIEKWVKHEIDV